MAARKKASSSPKAKAKVEKVMHEFKHGQLKSGRSGKKVSNPKQAIAIGLSEARQAGAKIPKRGAIKKSAATHKKSTVTTRRKSTAAAHRTTKRKTASRSR